MPLFRRNNFERDISAPDNLDTEALGKRPGFYSTASRDGKQGEVRSGQTNGRRFAEAYPILRSVAGISAFSHLFRNLRQIPCHLVHEETGEKMPKKMLPEWFVLPCGEMFPEFDINDVLVHIAASLLLEARAYVGFSMNMNLEPRRFYLPDPRSVWETADQSGRRFYQVRQSLSAYHDTISPQSGGVNFSVRKQLTGEEMDFAVENMIVWTGGLWVPGSTGGASEFDAGQGAILAADRLQDYTLDHFDRFPEPAHIVAMSREAMPTEQKQKKNYKKKMDKSLAGGDRGNPKVIMVNNAESNVKVHTVGLSPQEADVTPARSHAQTEVAMLTGTPGSLLGMSMPGGSSHNSLQTMKAHWVSSTLSGLAITITKRFNRIVPDGYRFEMDLTKIGRGDIVALGKVAADHLRSGAFSPNDAREFMGMPRVNEEAMDKYYGDGNRLLVEEIAKQRAKTKDASQTGKSGDAGGRPDMS